MARQGGYAWVTNEMFDDKLAELLTDGRNLLSIPGLYEVVAEELNNEVLEALDEEREAKANG